MAKSIGGKALDVRCRRGNSLEKLGVHILCAFLCVMALGACSGPVYVDNYKLAVDLQIDGKARHGETVVSTMQTRQNITGYRAVGSDGEAIVLLLTDGSALTVPIMDPDPRPEGRKHPWGYGPYYGDGILFREYGIRATDFQPSGANPALEQLSGMRGVKSLSPGDLPDLVYFTDAKDKRSAHMVDPDNLVSIQGHKVALTSVSIEITSRPATHGIESKLPWLAGEQGWKDGCDFEFHLFCHISWNHWFLARLLHVP